MATDDLAWVPDACSLPSAQRPSRIAEFHTLFATALRGQRRPAPNRLRWELDPAAEGTARELAAREASCCSFFSFTFSVAATATGPVPRMEIEVPATHIEVLDALAARAIGPTP